jgi:Na+/melibiose symporter-like transporter
MSHPVQARPVIIWGRVIGLAAMQGAIALLWVIYNLYLPRLLEPLGFTKAFIAGLLVLESGLAVLMEPLMGSLSDRSQRWIGSRFPFIAIGVVLTAVLFFSLPQIAFSGLVQGWPWLAPVATIAWALAMTVFRSPVLSLLSRTALVPQLPQVASVLTLFGALVGAVGLMANQWLLSLGAGVTFAAGSVVLLAAALVLRLVDPVTQNRPSLATPVLPGSLSLGKLGLIFGAGVGISLGFMILRSLLGPTPNQKSLLIVFTLVHVLTILPAGLLAVKWGNRFTMLLGIGVLSLGLILWNLTDFPLLRISLTAMLGLSFSLIINGTLPFALSLVPVGKEGLGTGLYFSGGALAASLFGTVTAQSGPLPAVIAPLIATLAFVGAAFCIASSQPDPVLHKK